MPDIEKLELEQPQNLFKKLVLQARKYPRRAIIAFIVLVIFAIGNQLIGSLASMSLTGAKSFVGMSSDLVMALVSPARKAEIIHPSSKIWPNSNYAKLDIFVCERSGHQTGNIFRFADKTAEAHEYKEVRVRYIPRELWPNSFPFNRTIIVYDAGHGEAGWLHFLMKRVHEARIFDPPIVLANQGEKTPWYLSLFICQSPTS